ncbi:hypothetical protein BGX28_004318 [Mortierella sp. GBA30]|nr:hypothetical protein BGX28_004318 [Mortierella sp. GBA30]
MSDIDALRHKIRRLKLDIKVSRGAIDSYKRYISSKAESALECANAQLVDDTVDMDMKSMEEHLAADIEQLRKLELELLIQTWDRG